MKRWRAARWLAILTVLFGGLLLLAWSVHEHSEQKAAAIREAGYQSVLRSYTAVLKQGMSREEVEAFLQTKGVPYQKISCIEPYEKCVYDDISKIGEEPGPWYCSRVNIYIAFQFMGESTGPMSANALDTLKKITVYPWAQDCL